MKSPPLTSSLNSGVLSASSEGGSLPTAVIDFETRSGCDLRAHGAWRYSKHPSTEVLCMAYQIDDGPVRLWKPSDQFPADLGNHIARCHLVEAHNYFFEKCIWAHVMTPRLCWPWVPPHTWRCTAALASRYNLPRGLNEVCKALKLPMQKDTGGRALMLKMCKPRKPTKNNPAKWHETPEDLARLYEYCKQDVRAEKALSNALPPLEPRELALWQWTEELNWRGVELDLDYAARAMDIFEACKRDGERQITRITGGKVTTAGQTARILEFCAEHGVELGNLQKPTVAEALHSNLPGEVRALLDTRASLGRAASISKFKAMLNRADLEDGRLRDHVRYFGAGPGRWAGQGVQTQNLPSRDVVKHHEAVDFIATAKSMQRPQALRLVRPDISKVLSSTVRPCFRAAPGKTFVCADFRAIEARVMAWFTGDPNLELFAANKDIYIEMASKIYEREITKDDKAERNLGKEAELACQYQLWWKTLLTRCWGRRINIDPELALKTVRLYRKNHPLVVKFWKELETAFIDCILYGKPAEVSCLRFEKTERDVRMVFPSGRFVVYTNPSVKSRRRKAPDVKPLVSTLKQLGTPPEMIKKVREMHAEESANTQRAEKQMAFYYRENTTNWKWAEVPTYGGKLAENACQGFAGDVVSESSLRLEAANFGDAVLTVHDELVLEVDEDRADLDGMIKVMCEIPPWAAGLPLAGSGWIGKEYRK